jgi:hypothetical protein
VVFERRSLDPVYYPAGGAERSRPPVVDAAASVEPVRGSSGERSRERQRQ